LTRADSIIIKQTQKPFDFSVDESVTRSKEEIFDFAKDLPSLSNRWLKRLKYLALDQLYDIVAEDSTGKTDFKTIISSNEAKVRERVKATEIRSLKKISDNPEGFENYVIELYLDALSTGFDPHTNYFSPHGKEEFQAELSSEALSFGLDLDENEKGQIVVDKLTPGGPAWKSGDLNKGDALLSLQWEGKEAVEMTGATVEDAYEVLGQSSNDRLVFKFQKADGTVRIVLLKKEKIENEENIVKGFVLKGEKKIGYILLPGFYTEWENESGSSCANDVAKEIVKLKKENIDGLILDVRFNGGGSVGEAIEMTGIFIDEGPVAGQKTKTGKVIYLKDPNRGTIYNGPLVLMVNGQSASASEMLAASLQDYNRAVIVGSDTYGKATMQQMFLLDTVTRKPSPMNIKNDMVKITTGKIYRLNGETAQLNGVKPDILLPDAFDGIDYREKFSSAVLPAETVAKNSYYKPLPLLPISELSKRSAERVNANKEFLDIKKAIELIRIQREKTEAIPLKWDGFEKWIKQNQLAWDVIKGKSEIKAKKFTVDNHSSDKTLLVNSEYAKEINDAWLLNIAEDIYIQEAFFILCDLNNLQKN
jgi:carboxyl-terminal processing protease